MKNIVTIYKLKEGNFQFFSISYVSANRTYVHYMPSPMDTINIYNNTITDGQSKKKPVVSHNISSTTRTRLIHFACDFQLSRF